MLHKISFCFDWIKLLDEVWPRRIALWIVVCVLNYKKYIKHALIYRVRKCDLCTWVRFKTFIIYIICTLNEGHKGIIDFIIFFLSLSHELFRLLFLFLWPVKMNIVWSKREGVQTGLSRANDEISVVCREAWVRTLFLYTNQTKNNDDSA